MPLVHKTQPVPRSKKTIEASSSQSGDKEPAPTSVFKIRFTGEKFRAYADYLERLDFYRQRIFTCRYTGSSNLTYEEALTSEFKSVQLSKLFCDIFTEPLERQIHGNQRPLPELVVFLQEYLNQNIFENETISVPYNVIYPDVAPSEIVLDGKIVSVDKKNNKVVVSLPKAISPDDNTKSESNSKNKPSDSASNSQQDKSTNLNKTEFVVDFDEIERVDRDLITDEVMINKIRTVASLGNYLNAPWLLHASILSKLSNPPKLSKEAKKAIDLKAPIPEPTKQEIANETKKRKREESKEASKGEPKPKKIATSTNNPANKTGESAASEPPKIKYPIEDLELLSPEHIATAKTKPPKTVELPRAASDFIVPQNCLSDLLIVTSFLNSFHDYLTLTPFPAEDLVNALEYDQHTTLLGEVHFRLLRHLSAHYQHLPKMTAKVWQPHLLYWLQQKRKLFGHLYLLSQFKHHGYFHLTVPQKLTILAFLVNAVSNSRLITDKIQAAIEKKAKLDKKAYEEQLEIRKKFKDPADASKTKANGAPTLKSKLAEHHEKYEKEVNKLPVLRVSPLGTDRYHNTYWWFGKSATKTQSAVLSNPVSISSLDSYVLVEYADGNIDYSGAPHLEDYFSDPEQRKEGRKSLQTEATEVISEDDEHSVESLSSEEAAENVSISSESDIEYDHNGRPKRKVKKSNRDEDEDFDDDEWNGSRRSESRTKCQICSTSKDLHKILLCDICDKAHHMYCLQPPLKKVPDVDWFCPVCAGGKLPPPPVQMPSLMPTRAGLRKEKEKELAKKEMEKKRQRKEQKQSKEASKPESIDLMDVDDEAEPASTNQSSEVTVNETRMNETTISPQNNNSSVNAPSTVPQEESKPAEPQPIQIAEVDSEFDSEDEYPKKRVKDVNSYNKNLVSVRWAYYETAEEIEQLMNWLDERGIRERALKTNLKKKFDSITSIIHKRNQQLKWQQHELNVPARRSTRTHTTEKKTIEPFMAYINKAGEAARER